jgi:hypothetical protein
VSEEKQSPETGAEAIAGDPAAMALAPSGTGAPPNLMAAEKFRLAKEKP